MVSCSSYDRAIMFKQLEKESLDVLVIGGGITGAGISLDAVTRGLKTGLVDMQDFSEGTSSRSTKLVHGGLRYLKQFDLKVVAEVGKERAVVYENGPHVTTPEWMMLPFHKGGTFGPLTTNLALLVYDFLAGVKKEERRTMLSATEAKKREPLLNPNGLKGAGYYVEYKTDDARLTIEVLKKAVEKGAIAVNYAKGIKFIYDENNKVSGIEIEDQINGEKYLVYAKKIINAAGPWVDKLREIDGSKQGHTLMLTKGVHLVFSKGRFPLHQAIYFDAPDGRMIFAIPRNNKAYIGTTDTIYEGDIAHPIVTRRDRDYLLEAINETFPALNLQAKHIESSWAGVRPLIAEDGKNLDEISRKDEVFTADSGLISIAGGKLTGYRKMAEEVVDMIVNQLKTEEGILYSGSETYHLPISGGEVGGNQGFSQLKTSKIAEGKSLGMPEKTISMLVQRYGKNIDTVMEIFDNKKVKAIEEAIDPVTFAELNYTMEYEFVYKPTDFFIRRTGGLFFDINWVIAQKENVIDYMAKCFHWTVKQTDEYRADLNQLLLEASSQNHSSTLIRW